MKNEKLMAPTLLSDGYSMLLTALSDLLSVAYLVVHICVTNLAVCCSSGTFVGSTSSEVDGDSCSFGKGPWCAVLTQVTGLPNVDF